MSKLTKCLSLIAQSSLAIALISPSYGQQTNNSSSLTNSAAPAASASTTGGTNINYQTNNTYQNEFGFGPGVFCRTPTVYVGGNYGQNSLSAYDVVNNSGNTANSYALNAGIVVPIGSQVIDSCKRVASSIVEDRLISTQLSLIRACASLQREGIRVNPELYPMLEKCTVSVIGPSAGNQVNLSPATIRSNPQPQMERPVKVPQTTRS